MIDFRSQNIFSWPFALFSKDPKYCQQSTKWRLVLGVTSLGMCMKLFIAILYFVAVPLLIILLAEIILIFFFYSLWDLNL
jgi:hypothetical protein